MDGLNNKSHGDGPLMSDQDRDILYEALMSIVGRSQDLHNVNKQAGDWQDIIQGEKKIVLMTGSEYREWEKWKKGDSSKGEALRRIATELASIATHLQLRLDCSVNDCIRQHATLESLNYFCEVGELQGRKLDNQFILQLKETVRRLRTVVVAAQSGKRPLCDQSFDLTYDPNAISMQSLAKGQSMILFLCDRYNCHLNQHPDFSNARLAAEVWMSLTGDWKQKLEYPKSMDDLFNSYLRVCNLQEFETNQVRYLKQARDEAREQREHGLCCEMHFCELASQQRDTVLKEIRKSVHLKETPVARRAVIQTQTETQPTISPKVSKSVPISPSKSITRKALPEKEGKSQANFSRQLQRKPTARPESKPIQGTAGWLKSKENADSRKMMRRDDAKPASTQKFDSRSSSRQPTMGKRSSSKSPPSTQAPQTSSSSKAPGTSLSRSTRASSQREVLAKSRRQGESSRSEPPSRPGSRQSRIGPERGDSDPGQRLLKRKSVDGRMVGDSTGPKMPAQKQVDSPSSAFAPVAMASKMAQVSNQVQATLVRRNAVLKKPYSKAGEDHRGRRLV